MHACMAVDNLYFWINPNQDYSAIKSYPRWNPKLKLVKLSFRVQFSIIHINKYDWVVVNFPTKTICNHIYNNNNNNLKQLYNSIPPLLKHCYFKKHLSLSSPSFPPPSTNKQLFDVLDQVSRFGLQRASFLGIQTTMALNCLTSCQFMDGNMSDSDGEHRRGECCRKLCCVKVWRRRCQGNILLYEKMRIGTLNMATEKVRKSHCRSYSTGVAAFVGGTEPRLVRSCAMRRDWSFEDVSRGWEEIKGENYDTLLQLSFYLIIIYIYPSFEVLVLLNFIVSSVVCYVC